MTLDLSALAGLLTGAVVPLLIYLLSRGAQLRSLNTGSDATLVTSATTLVTTLQTEVGTLTGKIQRLERDRDADRADFAAQLGRAHDENSRLSVTVAQLQTDLDIVNRQLATLRKINGGGV